MIKRVPMIDPDDGKSQHNSNVLLEILACSLEPCAVCSGRNRQRNSEAVKLGKAVEFRRNYANHRKILKKFLYLNSYLID